MENFITHPATNITRNSEGHYSDETGLWIDGETSIIVADLCIQPTGKERLLLPETVREKQAITIYSNTELIATSDNLKLKGDVIEYKNNNYQIYSITDYFNAVYDINYFRSIAVLMDKEGSYA